MASQLRNHPRILVHHSLVCLTHPLSLLSIILLLINDHIFKWYFPSWLTGKLSDLSGLFFFPFLLTILLVLLLGKRWARWSMPTSIMLTALIFIGIKTSPGMNSYLSRLLSFLFNLPVTIALDPTDLSALITLPASWLIWKQNLNRIHDPSPSRKQWLTLAMASIATIATQPCMPIPEIARVVSSDASFYSTRSIDYSDEPQTLVSLDGHAWEIIEPESLPSAIQVNLNESAFPASIHCNPAAPDRCYRISTNQQTIEISDDGGNSWRKDYRIPVERITYMKHLARAPLSCLPDIDLIPRDLALLPQSDGEIVLVAMGYQGALLHAPDGIWERVAVLDSEPLPLQANDLGDTFWILIYETLLFLILLPVAWTVLHVKGWNVTLSQFRVSKDEIQLFQYALRPFVAAILLLILAYLLKPIDLLFSPILWLVILLLLFAGPIVLGLQLHKPYRATSDAWAVSRYSALVLFLLATAWLPLAAWALGFIPWYSLSIALSLAWLHLASRFGWRRMKARIPQHISSTDIPSVDGS